jgi:hypothetical protein
MTKYKIKAIVPLCDSLGRDRFPETTLILKPHAESHPIWQSRFPLSHRPLNPRRAIPHNFTFPSTHALMLITSQKLPNFHGSPPLSRWANRIVRGSLQLHISLSCRPATTGSPWINGQNIVPRFGLYHTHSDQNGC